jgi:hypothetical protein
MREGTRRRPIAGWGLALAACLLGLWLASPAVAAPINDNYLNSLRLNDPGTVLDRVHTLRDLRDTTGATVQSDVFNPPMTGGPAEPTACQGVSYGSTVWYDFHPDINGSVRIRTSGYNTVISLIPFSDKTLLPDLGARLCVPNLSTMTQELDTSVIAGRAYTIQIGGVAGATGSLEFLFDFIPTIARISADATLIATGLSSGIRVNSLKVSAPRGARVEVKCSRGCRTQARTASTLGFPGLRGARLPVGAKLEIFVTAPNAIGTYIEYRIRRANFSKITRCLEPKSVKPRLSCS